MQKERDPTIQRTKSRKVKEVLECAVCEDMATGFNFGRVSCESCKAFFRRNSMKNPEKLSCRFDGNCRINVKNRRHCTSCRIRKCFSIGMKIDPFLSERRRSSNVPIADSTKNVPFLSANDRIRIESIFHLFQRFGATKNASKNVPIEENRLVDSAEFLNGKRIFVVDLINFLKNLPDFGEISIDDQVLLVKVNLRSILSIHFAILRFNESSTMNFDMFDSTLAPFYRQATEKFIRLADFDSDRLKLFLLATFFLVNTQTINHDQTFYSEPKKIQRIHSSYTELLWLYLLEKHGEKNAVKSLDKLVNSFLHSQIINDRIDSLIRLEPNMSNLDSLMKVVFQIEQQK